MFEYIFKLLSNYSLITMVDDVDWFTYTKF